MVVTRLQQHLPLVNRRLDHKLRRRELPPEGPCLVQRALHRIRVAFAVAAPRVAFSFFQLLWNSWTTSRRFQGRLPC
eukprot:7595899-Prorocentrum_lima.AAC.1